jgi:hypothetical protein
MITGRAHSCHSPHRTGVRPVSYCADLRLCLSRAATGLFAVWAIAAARNFAIRLMSLTGTGLVSGKRTVPLRSSYPLSSSSTPPRTSPTHQTVNSVP